MRTLTLGMLAMAASGCLADPDDGETWRLAWEENFDGAEGSAPDPSVWVIETGRGPNGDGWGNQELQYYTDRPANVDLDGNGFLRIRARREAFEGAEWTSARIKTQGKQSFTYGRIEASINVPAGQGLWPAFWSMGEDITEVPWPGCGEIDILEVRGQEPDVIFGTIHGPGYAGADSVGALYKRQEGPFAGSFHTVAIEWDPNHIAWYLDDALYHTTTPGDLPPDSPWVFDHDFFLLLNLAVGGTFLGPGGGPDGTTPDVAAMGVDYIRVYERVAPLSEATP
jgi:beta-glucanase (GH16 family)